MIGELIKAHNDQNISQKELEDLSEIKQPSIARVEKIQLIDKKASTFVLAFLLLTSRNIENVPIIFTNNVFSYCFIIELTLRV